MFDKNAPEQFKIISETQTFKDAVKDFIGL